VCLYTSRIFFKSLLFHLPEQEEGCQTSEHSLDSYGRHHQGNYKRKNSAISKTNKIFQRPVYLFSTNKNEKCLFLLRSNLQAEEKNLKDEPNGKDFHQLMQ